jgi:hypothetical protein
VGDGTVQTRVEAANNVVDQVLVIDRRIKSTQAIGHGLHAGAVVKHREIALIDATNLHAEVDRPRGLVVAEQGAHARLEELGGDVVVELGDDILQPVAFALGRGFIDVVTEAVLAEDSEERTHLGSVVGIVEIKDDRNARLDVDAVGDGRRSILKVASVWTQSVYGSADLVSVAGKL